MKFRDKKQIAHGLLAAMLLALILGSGLHAQDQDVTNARILELTKLGLDDDVIIGKIKSSKCSFQLADKDLVTLKNAGVSTKVIAAMLNANTVTVTRVIIDRKPVELHDFINRDPGDNLFIRGQHADVNAGPRPKIILELPKNGNIVNYMLVQLEAKNNRRVLARNRKFQPLSTVPLGENKFKVTLEAPLKPGEYIIWVLGSYDLARNVFGRGYDFTVQ